MSFGLVILKIIDVVWFEIFFLFRERILAASEEIALFYSLPPPVLAGVLRTVDSEHLKLNRAYIVHFVSLFKVLLSILHLNTIIALFFHF